MKKVKVRVSVKSLFEIERREKERPKYIKKIVFDFIKKYRKKINLDDVDIKNIYICHDLRLHNNPLEYLEPLTIFIMIDLISENDDYALFLKEGDKFSWIGIINGKELNKHLKNGRR